MTLRSLRIFIMVAEMENMTRVAEALFTTQSSISQVIADIEKEYDILLFERLKNSLRLTSMGKDMLKYAKNIIHSYDELDNALRHGSSNPRIRIGASATVGSTIIKALVDQLIETTSNLEYSTFINNTQQIEEKILKNEIDVAIVEGAIKSEDIIEIELLEDPLVLICSKGHRLYGRSGVNLAELANEPLIIREEGSGTRKTIIERFDEKKIKPNIVWTCNNQEIVKKLVKDNLGITVISKKVVAEEIENGELWGCSIDDVNLSRTFRLIYHKDKFITPTIDKFINLSKEYCKA